MERSFPPLQLWGGVECTYSRVNDERTDQLELSGHAARVGDLDLIADLGIRVVRYPVLWDHVYRTGRPDWSWADERLERLAELRIEPMVGLLHHSAGPGEGGFFDPDLPERFAEFAHAVADRYPWLTMYCPINEPLTTARFCGLYGVWHPHARDRRAFAQILMAQLRATVSAVRAIKQVRPDAVFVQNEDLGTARATAELEYQARFENERRWIVFDLLTGALQPGDVMWSFLRDYGITDRELEAFVGDPCPPDIVGVDHYVTSDRWLDHRIDRYPEHTHGRNGRHVYANVEAVRATEEDHVGLGPLLDEAWSRYAIPLSITEAHLGSTRDEQLRWIDETWRTAIDARTRGTDVRAVTVWALLGSYDWNTLCTERNGFYEAGAFDLRSGAPRETAIAAMMRGLAHVGAYDHPVLDGSGWWRRTPERLFHPPERPAPRTGAGRERAHARRILYVGPPSTLADGVARIADVRDLAVTFAPEPDEIDTVLSREEPWLIIAATECSWGVAEAPMRRMRSTAHSWWPSMAHALDGRDIPVVFFSCAHVVDERLGRPRHEGDPVVPSRPCGTLAAAAEHALEAAGRALIVRTGPLFAPWRRDDPLAAAACIDRELLDDTVLVSPTYVPDLVNEALDLAIDGAVGTWHLVNGSSVTERELGDLVRSVVDRTASRAGGPRSTVTTDLTLTSRRAALLPSLHDALARYIDETDALDVRGRLVRAPTGPEFLGQSDTPTATRSEGDGVA